MGLKTLILTLAGGGWDYDGEIMMKEGNEKATTVMAEASSRLLMHSQVRTIWEELMIIDKGWQSTRDQKMLLHLSTHFDTTLSLQLPSILLSSPLGKKAMIGSSLF